ncbi:phospholipase D-like domain-containing protein [Chroococcus sp. FPU101]|uniref:phospholipase D-like domain-containing protein n=1 Tax=Chroococcus sp. FPU101 TaxID=1974212 RepID=UPI001A8D7B6A|nr:phospholipase D-like domain-containing protein [Chroococcus sp. FPU101]GFE71446.1 hypothetical protein CFPU101_40560 [Chroococcus sp. FPU101]
MTVEYYFSGDANIVERWKRELKQASGRVIVFSPYLTNLALEVLTLIKDKENSEIYTRFDFDLFNQGSSSIKTLKTLLDLGFQIYELSKLHAKLIIIPDRFVSIGSQNLTTQGQYNLEANMVSTDKDDISWIKDLAGEWLINRKLITFERIKEFEEQLSKQRVIDIENPPELIELEPIDNDNDVPEAPQRKASEVVYGTVKFESNRYSLIIDKITTLSKWNFENEEVDLEKIYQGKYKRYLCVKQSSDLEIYSFAWVRLAGTRITYTFDEPPPPREITIDNVKINLTIAETTNLIPKSKDSANIKILLELTNFVFADSYKAVFLMNELSITFESNFYFSPYKLKNLSLELYSTEEQLNQLLNDIESNTTCWVQTINEQDNEPRVFYYYSKLNTYLTNNVITC